MNDTTPLVKVRLLEVPVDLHRQASEHQEALRRELAFVEHAQGPDAAPARLQALTADLNERYGGLTQAQNDRIDAAIEAGEERLELEYELPPDVTDMVIRVGELLDELDQFCRDGDLLTLVTPPDLLVYRRWFLEEFVAQIRDARDPRPWTGPTTIAVEDTEDDEAGGAVRIEVHDDLDLGSAPELRSQLVAHAEAGVTRVTIDLSGCRFLDSTGLSLLVSTHHRLMQAGGGLRVEAAAGQVRNILDMAGATEFFDQG